MLTIATIIFWLTFAAIIGFSIYTMVTHRHPSPRLLAIVPLLNLGAQLYLVLNGSVTCTVVCLVCGLITFTTAGLTYERIVSVMKDTIKYMEEYPLDDEEEETTIDDIVIHANPPGEEELIDVYLDPNKTPVAFHNKVEELMEEGVFERKEDAERHVKTNPIALELYYEKHEGLFAVEPEAVEEELACSPYTVKPFVTED